MFIFYHNRCIPETFLNVVNYNINIWCNISDIYILRIRSVGGRQSTNKSTSPHLQRATAFDNLV